MTNVEKAARALAVASQKDPDAQSGALPGSDYTAEQLAAIARGEVVRPIWRDYEREAKRFLAVLAALDLLPGGDV